MAARTVYVAGGGGSAGVLLLFVAIVGLVALFTGNLDRWINAIAGKQGGAPGLGGSTAPPPPTTGAATGAVDTVHPPPLVNTRPTRAGVGSSGLQR